MASLRSFYASDGSKPELKTNMNVDYVINYRIPSEAQAEAAAEAEAGFVQLIEALTKVGLATEVRNGVGNASVLVFTKVASEKYLKSKIYRERVQDWLSGVRIKAPEKNIDKVFEDEPVSDAERLRLVYLLMTNPKNEGGAGISPKKGHWKYVESVFPLHNHAFNRQWIKQWSSKYVLHEQDIDQIRDKFGEKIAFYFAFLQSYFTFLLFPAAFGFAAWLILGQYSWAYAAINSLWSVVFFEYWKKKEVDLAVQWGVRGVSRIQHPRTQFRWEAEVEDPVTGEPIKVYSNFKRLQTQLLQVPFGFVCMLILGALYVFCFSIEIFITEIYNGPFKSILTFLPTIILTALLPALSTILGNLAGKLTDAENYQTHDAHDAAMIQKVFVVNFITSYIPLFLTAFVYMPFGNLLVPYLDVFKVTAEQLSASEKPLATEAFQINADRLKKQIIYFTVTAQVVNFATEVIAPYVKRKVFEKVKKVQSEMAQKKRKTTMTANDVPEEAAFLERVRNEAQLDVYDVATDYREMVVQFGYLSLFSAVWPLTPVSFLINNWVELRSDAMKMAISCQRPIPWRADSIGPWLNSLGFLSWFGSLISTAIIFLCSDGCPDGVPSKISGAGLLLSILTAEHLYLLAQWAVQHVLNQMDSPGLQKERAERFLMRKNLLEETLGQEVTEKPRLTSLQTGEMITLAALEEEARQASIRGHGTPEESFWQRQQGMQETIAVGRNLISKMASENKPEKS